MQVATNTRLTNAGIISIFLPISKNCLDHYRRPHIDMFTTRVPPTNQSHNTFRKQRMRLKSYREQASSWPKSGQHILAQTGDGAVIVYQAFKPCIAQYAVDNNKFGGPHYSMSRMTWIKTNFLWMMFRSDWGRAQNQERESWLSMSGWRGFIRY